MNTEFNAWNWINNLKLQLNTVKHVYKSPSYKKSGLLIQVGSVFSLYVFLKIKGKTK